jgi:hypothetical protein
MACSRSIAACGNEVFRRLVQAGIIVPAAGPTYYVIKKTGMATVVGSDAEPSIAQIRQT